MGDLTRLTKAVNQGDLRQVRTILETSRDCQLLLDNGAEINKADGQFGATPTGWAIEYLRERGGFLAIELNDLANAVEHGDAKWVVRFLKRFPPFANA